MDTNGATVQAQLDLEVPVITVPEARTTLRNTIYPVDEELGCRVPSGEQETCPVCDRPAQVHKWSLYGTAARFLILVYRAGGTEFIHTNEIKAKFPKFYGQGDGARLRYWRLAEQPADRREDGGKSGYWRATALGEQFVQRTATIPKFVDIYANKVLRVYGPEQTIDERLGKRFNYDELMSARMT